jgi:TRAP-type C4-dicarboxylate transport system permease small subunit
MRVFVIRLTDFMSVIAGVVLIFMVILTFADVVMRYMGSPIPGVYEIVAYLGVIVTGFALPRASMKKTHVYVDLVIDKMPRKPKRAVRTGTRILVALFFLCTAWYFLKMGVNFITTNSVTMTLRVPFYPVVFGMALSCLVQSMVSVFEIFEQGEENL